MSTGPELVIRREHAAHGAVQEDQGRFLLALLGVLQCVVRGLRDAPLTAALVALQDASQRLLEEATKFDLRLTRRGLRVVDAPPRFDAATQRHLVSLEGLLRRLRIGSLKVRRGVQVSEWQALAQELAQALHAGHRGLTRRPGALGSHLDVGMTTPEQAVGDRDGRARDSLHALHVAMQALLAHPADATVTHLRQLKRAMQVLVDQVMTNETALLLRRALDLHAGGLAEHSMQVGLLSVAMGHQLQLDRAALLELGLCGVLHDIGKRRLAPEIVDKRGALTESEWQEMKRHPREGLVLLQTVLRNMVDRWRPMLAAYEHHMKTDQSGYPVVRRPRQVGLYSRIVSVADVYDAVTSPRSYRARPWRPELVLRNMLDQPRWGLDRSLVKVLIQAIGLFPVGSLVQLDDGAAALVLSVRPDCPHAPHVRILATASGSVWPRVEEADLVLPGSPKVVCTLDPRQFPIDIRSVLAQACASGA